MINISEIVLKTQHHNEVPGKAQQKFVVTYKVSLTVMLLEEKKKFLASLLLKNTRLYGREPIFCISLSR